MQLYDKGIGEYFQGWNLTDFSQIWCYLAFFYIRYMQVEHSKDLNMTLLNFLPHLKYMILFLSFIKIMYFVRIYQEYGFLVQMVILTIEDLVPFLHALIFSIFFFAICFFVLEIDIDDDIKDVTGPGFNMYGLIFLQTYRIAMGEIGVPAYEDLEKNENVGKFAK